MKKILLMLSMIICLHGVYAQAQTTTLTVSRTNPKAGDSLYNLANLFAKQVGDSLKLNYPAKIQDISVKLEYENNVYTLTYTAVIELNALYNYDYYFDRRGYLTTKSTVKEAWRDAAEKKNAAKELINTAFKQQYGHFRPIKNIFISIHCGQNCETALAEYFIASK